MATPSVNPFEFTNDPLIDVSTNGYKWNLSGDRTINWSISNAFNGDYWGNPSGLVEILNPIFNVLSRYIDVNFKYTGYFDKPTTAYFSGSDINISLANLGNDLILAGAFYPAIAANNTYLGAPGDIFLNTESSAFFLAICARVRRVVFIPSRDRPYLRFKAYS